MKNMPLIITVSVEKEIPVGYKVLKTTDNGNRIVIRNDATYMAKVG